MCIRMAGGVCQWSEPDKLGQNISFSSKSLRKDWRASWFAQWDIVLWEPCSELDSDLCQQNFLQNIQRTWIFFCSVPSSHLELREFKTFNLGVPIGMLTDMLKKSVEFTILSNLILSGKSLQGHSSLEPWPNTDILCRVITMQPLWNSLQFN